MTWKCTIFCLLLTTVSIMSFGQKSNERSRVVRTFNTALKLDSLTIVPGSTTLPEQESIRIVHDIDSGTVMFMTQENIDSIAVQYRVFPYDLTMRTGGRKYSVPDSTKGIAFSSGSGQAEFREQDQREELVETDQVYKSGVLSRGISFGNRQDIFVNSVLNLQLDGKLSDQLNIRASITDQNIPYQPEGNTELVQDFDNVYFEIYNDDVSLSGGDIVLRNDPSHFLRFNRNVQGVRLQAGYGLLEEDDARSTVSYSVSKGKFHSSRLEPLDGVMGPYKIYGPEGKGFIIIVAGSERVYLDGKLLQRGFNQDYVIDYNTAEITFTSRVLITRFSRINIDFEYTNQGYSRSVLNAGHRQTSDKFEISVQFFQEKDNRNQPLLHELSPEDKMDLSGIDSSGSGTGLIRGWDSVAFSASRVLYERVDTVLSGERRVSFFRVSQDPEKAGYQVHFTETSPGEGDYERQYSTLNGQYYEWVGDGQGSYIPYRTMPLPEISQMIALRGKYVLSSHLHAFSEVAISRQDQNLFNIREQGNRGMAVRSGIAAEQVDIKWLPGYTYSGEISMEYDGEGFRGIDRFRDIEYDRNWGYDPERDSLPAGDRIITVKQSIAGEGNNFTRLEITRRDRSRTIHGFQVAEETSFDVKRWHLNGSLFFLDNTNPFRKTEWIKYHAETYLKTRFFFPGYAYTADRNQISLAGTDSVMSSLMNFEEHRFFLRNNDTLKTRFNISHSIRKDRLPLEGEMVDRFASETTTLMAGTGTGKLGSATFNLTWRKMNDLHKAEDPMEESLMGQANWKIDLLDKHLRQEIIYAIGNGRELKRDYIFMPVPAGEGTHTWRDDNGNGIQEIQEFYLAINADERNFIKLFTPTDEYVLAYDQNLNYRLQAGLPRSWSGESGWKKIMARFSNSLMVNLRQKTAREDFMDHLFFTGREGGNEELISYHDHIRNTFHFNRADPRYGFDLIYLKKRHKQLVLNGFESRDRALTRAIGRVNINRAYSIRLILERTETKSASDFMTDRDYIIDGKELRTELDWQPTNFWRLSGQYAYRMNTEQAVVERPVDFSNINEATLGFRYSRAADKSIESTVRYVYIDFSGQENSAMGYDLLQGLQPGDNFTWRLNWQQQLINGLQLNLSYEGRKSADQTAVHVGRMQLMALF